VQSPVDPDDGLALGGKLMGIVIGESFGPRELLGDFLVSARVSCGSRAEVMIAMIIGLPSADLPISTTLKRSDSWASLAKYSRSWV